MDARRRLYRLMVVGAAVVALTAGCAGPSPTPQSLSTTAIPTPQATSSLAPSFSLSPSSSSTPPPSSAALTPSPLALVTPPAPSTSTPSPSTRPSLADVLAELRVAPEHRTGYRRTLFRIWIDADGNGCDTRHEVLIAEAIVAPTVSARCALSGGRWISLYDGLTFTDASKLDIDHVVPLAEAWDSGAYRWTAARRQAFANDLGVSWSLIAVSAASNRSKGDKDPAGWLPPLPGYRCEYLAVWVAIKERWSLAVDPAEKSAIAGEAGCQDTPVPLVTPVGGAALP